VGFASRISPARCRSLLSSMCLLKLALSVAPLLAGAAYDPSLAVSNALRHFDRPQHNCSTAYTACTPYSYWGEEACGFASHGGDCANFLSQNLLAGGHPPLIKAPCRGYPCGREEVGAANLGRCLAANYGWRSTCGARQPPPADVRPGDALVFHAKSCDDAEAHAMLAVALWGSRPTVRPCSTRVGRTTSPNLGTSTGCNYVRNTTQVPKSQFPAPLLF